MADPPQITSEDLDRVALSVGDLARLDAVVVPLRPKKKPVRRLSASAVKVRAYRQRQRLGLAVLRVTVPEYDVIDYLIATGRLSAAEAMDRRRVERAVAEILIELAHRWLPHRM